MDIRRIFERIDQTGEFDRSSEKETFDMIAGEIQSQMEQAGITGPEDLRNNDKTVRFLEGLRLVVKYAPGLKFLGEGSSRYVYSMGSGKYVLKAAKNYMGLIQNQNEIDVNMSGSADYDCFVRVLKFDPARIFIVEDACEEITMSGWTPLIGISLHRFVQIVRIVLERRESEKGYSLRDLLDACEKAGAKSELVRSTFEPKDGTEPAYRPEDFDGIISFMRNMVDSAEGRPASELWRSLFDIFRFYFEVGQKKLVIGELPWSEQWGLCGAGADRRIVLVDPGVNSDFAAQR